MPATGGRFSPRRLIAIAVLGMALLGSGIYFGVNYAVDLAVRQDARQKASHWAEYFLTAMPDLDRLIADGRLDPAQTDIVQTARTLGDVFRFKLYDTTARQVLVSDDKEEADTESPDHNDEAAEALDEKTSEIEIQSGVEGYPPLYVEAYVPIVADDGHERGVVEVYIDQTATDGLFRTTFAALAVGLAIITALAFGLPTIGFLLRSRQASEANQQVAFLAHHDPLTGLLNRTTFGTALEQQLRTAQPPGGPAAAVLAFDVDDFKAINEGFGQEVGDEFLRHVGRVLSGVSPAGSLLARPGNDEFVLALFGLGRGDVLALAEAVIQVVGEPIIVAGKAVSGALSAGIYFAATADSRDEVLHRASVALSQAKLDGRGLYRVFSPDMEANLFARRELERLIRQATTDKSFEVYFQPLLRADSKLCVGFEALLRLPDGKGNLVNPAVFIPVAEAMGLITEIGQWVIEESARIAVHWPDHLIVSVNLSVKQFADGRLVGHVRNALAASGLAPRRLELEVTESMLVADTAAVAAQIKDLRALGVSIAMDDFGTGYSSLGYLWQFGFDKLKIDRSFISALDRDEGKAREILDTIILLGHKLGMTVTAEGIETEHQADVLSDLACDHFQGYFYGRPVPVTEIASFLIGNLGPAAVAPTPRARSA